MGLKTNEPKIETTTHFSHKHPLKLINHNPHQQTQNYSSECAGCKVIPSGSIYSCTICPFFLHKKCFDMPRTINHPYHKAHPLILLQKPAYPGGQFGCDACGGNGSGFSYHCKPCGRDLHLLCADSINIPRYITHASHPHKLDLAFECPYVTKSFMCDICRRDGSDQWVYRCNSCGFDAHVSCARGYPPPLKAQPQQLQPPAQPPQNSNFTSLQAYIDALAQQSQPTNLPAYLNPTPHVTIPQYTTGLSHLDWFTQATQNNNNKYNEAFENLFRPGAGGSGGNQGYR